DPGAVRPTPSVGGGGAGGGNGGHEAPTGCGCRRTRRKPKAANPATTRTRPARGSFRPARPRTGVGPFPDRAIGKGPRRFGHLFGTSLRGAPPPRSSDRRPGVRHHGHATPVPAPRTTCARTPTAR